MGVKEYCPVFWSVPQMRLPAASVSRAWLQLRTVWSWRPPPVRTRPFTVDDAEVALRRVVERPPANVEVAVEVEVRVPTVS